MRLAEVRKEGEEIVERGNCELNHYRTIMAIYQANPLCYFFLICDLCFVFVYWCFVILIIIYSGDCVYLILFSVNFIINAMVEHQRGGVIETPL